MSLFVEEWTLTFDRNGIIGAMLLYLSADELLLVTDWRCTYDRK